MDHGAVDLTNAGLLGRVLARAREVCVGSAGNSVLTLLCVGAQAALGWGTVYPRGIECSFGACHCSGG